MSRDEAGRVNDHALAVGRSRAALGPEDWQQPAPRTEMWRLPNLVTGGASALSILTERTGVRERGETSDGGANLTIEECVAPAAIQS